jgi:hypothetical protein
MSLENSFERIAVALEAIAAGNGYTVIDPPSDIEPPAAKPTETIPPKEEIKPTETIPPKEEIKPTETIPPKEEIKSPFDQAVNQQAASTAGPTHTSEFTDKAGLVAYAMKAYQEVGAEKGAKIQGALGTLGTLGYTNINDVKPEHFQGFFDAVEAIKRGE